MKKYALGAFTVALATTVVVQAAPQRVGIGFVPVPTVFPITNATVTPGPSKPKPTDPRSSCEASCVVRYPQLYGLSWAREDQIVYTETVTVATISIITTSYGNFTDVSTHTVYDNDANVPLYHTLYHIATNDKGTKVVEAGITLSDGYTYTTFAYPTPFVDYPSQYHWQGILPTLGKYDEPRCTTWTEEFEVAEVTPHPLYPQPTDVVADKRDPIGMEYVPLWIPLPDTPDKEWFDGAFPSESAFALCESIVGKSPPDIISTAKFVTTTATAVTTRNTAGLVHTENPETGWEGTPTKGPPGVFEPTQKPESGIGESSITGFPQPSTTSRLAPPSSIRLPEIPDIVSTVPPWNAQPSARPSPPLVQNSGTTPGARPVSTRRIDDVQQPASTPGNENGAGQPAPTRINRPELPNPVVSNPGRQPAAAPPQAHITPIFTFVPTTIDGRPTAAPVFIVPGTSSTASVGQTITRNGQTTVLTAPTIVPASLTTATIGQTINFDGQTTVLTPPSAVFAIVPTTINGVATSAPAFIISGTSTATIGQTVTLDGQTTVLAAPAPFATEIPTTIFGIETHVTAFIISGSITAFPGQTITLDGQVTALPTADVVFAAITTTIDGKETVIPAYIISGSVSATVGQTVTIDGTTTVLTTPTPDVAFTSITTTINGKETVVPVYIISGSITATLGQMVTVEGTTTVLSTPTETDASAASSSPTETDASAASFPAEGGGQPQETGSAKGAGGRGWTVPCNKFVLALGVFFVAWL